MKKIPVRLPGRAYQILIGKKLLERVPQFLRGLGLDGKLLIVTERRAAGFHLSRLVRSFQKIGVRPEVFYLAGGEKAKTQSELFRLLRFLLKKGFERRDALLALGGGAVGDAAGFAASTYLRGISLIQAGTTLLAQVDSSIGGKTGINLAEGKNLVGTFYQPRLVVSDVSVLKTLPSRELRTSLAEVIKYGVIRDAALFRFLEKRTGPILKGDLQSLEKIVAASARIKAGVVERDERETKGERMILNYGHTFGHAFEAAQSYRGLRHGEAVALGMVCAARLARRLGMISAAVEARQNRLIQRAGLPVSLAGFRFNTGRVLHHMGQDKKKKGGALRFVLPTAIGKVKVVDDVRLADVKKILLDLRGE